MSRDHRPGGPNHLSVAMSLPLLCYWRRSDQSLPSLWLSFTALRALSSSLFPYPLPFSFLQTDTRQHTHCDSASCIDPLGRSNHANRPLFSPWSHFPRPLMQDDADKLKCCLCIAYAPLSVYGSPCNV